MKIAITGATGLLGKKISERLIDRGDSVIIFSRSVEAAMKAVPNAEKYVEWNYKTGDWFSMLDGVDTVIHLAGENVMAKRWTPDHKRRILESRVNGTRSLVQAISSVNVKPAAFISASAVGYYGNSEFPVDESSLPANDFLSEVVNAWETETKLVEKYAVRRVNVRIGIVLDKNEGALAKMILPFKYFVGGPIGNGTQWFPWIHIDDVVNIFLFAIDNKIVTGPVNAVSPGIVRMNEFAKTLGNVMSRPAIFRVPSFILRLVLGKGSEAVLGGANVQSTKIRNLGYKFLFDDLTKALQNILPK